MNKRKFGIDWDDTIKKIDEQNDKKSSFKDDRIYYPQLKSDGTGGAVIRFLPSPDTDVPYVKVFSHSIQGPGGYYIQNCPTTHGNECPVCRANSKIWSENEDDVARKLTSRSKRKTSFYSNILIVNDPKNPDNNGKVFLYRYGVKIYKKIMDMIKPEIGKPVMVFDYYDGADFALIVNQQQVGKVKMPNYDASKFETPAPVADNDDAIEKIHNQRFGLAEFIDTEKFLAFDKLEEKYNKVMGVANTATIPANAVSNIPAQTATVVAETPAEAPAPAAAEETTTEAFDGDDESFFASLQKDQ